MSLHFHHESVALLPSVPAFSERNAGMLAERERLLGIQLPAAVREWYTLEGAVELLAKHSNDDQPIPLERLGAPTDNWYGDGRRDFVSESLLWIMCENQGVCNWAVRLDGTDAPPVAVEVDTAPRDEWLACTQTFSEFIYCQIWDHTRASAACSAQEPDLSEQDLVFLRSEFRKGPATHGWPGSNNYRFATPWGRILIWHAQDHGADWFLNADSPGALESMLRAVWHCGTLAKSLYHVDDSAREALRRVRGQTKANGT